MAEANKNFADVLQVHLMKKCAQMSNEEWWDTIKEYPTLTQVIGHYTWGEDHIKKQEGDVEPEYIRQRKLAKMLAVERNKISRLVEPSIPKRLTKKYVRRLNRKIELEQLNKKRGLSESTRWALLQEHEARQQKKCEEKIEYEKLANEFDASVQNQMILSIENCENYEALKIKPYSMTEEQKKIARKELEAKVKKFKKNYFADLQSSYASNMKLMEEALENEDAISTKSANTSRKSKKLLLNKAVKISEADDEFCTRKTKNPSLPGKTLKSTNRSPSTNKSHLDLDIPSHNPAKKSRLDVDEDAEWRSKYQKYVEQFSETSVVKQEVVVSENDFIATTTSLSGDVTIQTSVDLQYQCDNRDQEKKDFKLGNQIKNDNSDKDTKGINKEKNKTLVLQEDKNVNEGINETENELEKNEVENKYKIMKIKKNAAKIKKKMVKQETHEGMKVRDRVPKCIVTKHTDNKATTEKSMILYDGLKIKDEPMSDDGGDSDSTIPCNEEIYTDYENKDRKFKTLFVKEESMSDDGGDSDSTILCNEENYTYFENKGGKFKTLFVKEESMSDDGGDSDSTILCNEEIYTDYENKGGKFKTLFVKEESVSDDGGDSDSTIPCNEDYENKGGKEEAESDLDTDEEYASNLYLQFVQSVIGQPPPVYHFK